MNKLVFSTNNRHKLDEVRSILGSAYEIISLAEIGCNEEIPETADTLEGNALIKAKYVYDKYKLTCFADDTGLEVFALGGQPGVYSARYAGDEHNSLKNMEKLLHNLGNKNNREAQFRTVIVLIEDGEIKQFEGIIEGDIIREARGKAGFGYDPVFVPKGYTKTFAELGLLEKNLISHRALATQKLAEYLNSAK